MTHHSNRPLAAKPFQSYRYKGRYGFIMIGAANTEDALREARQSVTGPATVNNLDIWDAETARYLPVV